MDPRAVIMDKAGRLTLPEEARRAIGLTGEVTFELEADLTSGTLVLRPTGASRHAPHLFTPEQLESVARGLRDSREGRVRRLSEEDLVRLGGPTDADA